MAQLNTLEEVAKHAKQWIKHFFNITDKELK